MIEVLFVCANPRGSDPLRTAEEDRTLRESIQLSPNRDAVNVKTLPAANIDDLSRELLKKEYDIVHFSGHGSTKGLAFESIDGRLFIPASDAIAELLRIRGVSTVILNACYSLSVGHFTCLGLDFTVASAGPVSDPSAIEFTRGFYDAIGAGKDAAAAFEEGKLRARLKGLDAGVVLLRKGEEFTSPAAGAPAGAITREAKNASRPALLGFAIDTSGSMRENIRNDSNRSLSRLESVRLSLSSLADDLRADLRSELSKSHDTDTLRMFAYGFGLRALDGVADLVSVAKASKAIDVENEIETRKRRYEAQGRGAASRYSGLADFARRSGYGHIVSGLESAARASAIDKIAGEIGALLIHKAQSIGDSTVSVDEFADLWSNDASNQDFENLERLVYGATPMKTAASEILARFRRTAAREHEERWLAVVSDGEPTDGDPRSEFEVLASDGVGIISCFVTDQDVANPRVLLAKPDGRWSEGARLMFDIASPLDEGGELAGLLLSNGWELERGAKMFVQVNHSSVLDEFISVMEALAAEGTTQLLPAGR